MRRLALALCLLLAACAGGGDKRFPTSEDYPPGVMEHVTLTAPTEPHWRLSALRTVGREHAPWRLVIVTGTPSWNEYWAPTLAHAPDDLDIIVADRPGFARSEPRAAVTDIDQQAQALSAMLDAPPGQRIILLGQSYGAPIAVRMAAAHPDKVSALILLSAYFNDPGPTARRLRAWGDMAHPLLPRDLKNSIDELNGQAPQLPTVRESLRNLSIPVLFVHGDEDTFVSIQSARAVAEEFHRPLADIPNGDHFINACCVGALLAQVRTLIQQTDAPSR